MRRLLSMQVDGGAVSGDAALVGKLRSAVAAGRTSAVISCDKSRPYGEVIHVVDLAKQAGVTRLAFAVASP